MPTAQLQKMNVVPLFQKIIMPKEGYGDIKILANLITGVNEPYVFVSMQSYGYASKWCEIPTKTRRAMITEALIDTPYTLAPKAGRNVGGWNYIYSLTGAR